MGLIASKSTKAPRYLSAMSSSRIARAIPVLRALSQRAITTQSQARMTASADPAAVNRALAAAVAISRKAAQPASLPATRKPSAAHFEAITHQELAQKVEDQLQAQIAAVEADAAHQAMEAAAEHLRGIPLKSKHEYKSLIADYNARRS